MKIFDPAQSFESMLGTAERNEESSNNRMIPADQLNVREIEITCEAKNVWYWYRRKDEDFKEAKGITSFSR